MINFKQWDSYWNNFNNWDEAKLSDSTRPRDEFWFRIKPWMQSDKWDWRWANKNRYLDYCVNQWWVEKQWEAPANWTPVTVPLYFDNTGKFSVTWTYDLTTDYWESISKWEIIGSLWWQQKDWRLVIPETWNYMVQYYVEYNRQHWTTTTYATAPKLYTAPTYYDTKWNYKWILDAKAWWGIINPDLNEWLSIQMLDKWYSIWLICYNGRDWVKAFCRWCIKLLKLS